MKQQWTIGGTFTQKQLKFWKHSGKYFYRFTDEEDTEPKEPTISFSDLYYNFFLIKSKNKEFVLRVNKKYDLFFSLDALKFTHYLMEI